MKVLLIMGLMASFATPLSSQELRVEQLSGSFISPSGSASFHRLEVPRREPLNEQSLSLELIGQDALQIITDDEVFEWSDLPEALADLTAAEWSNLNLHLGETNFNMSGNSLRTVASDSDLNLSRLNFSCRLPASREFDLEQRLLEGCLNQQSSFNIQLFERVNKSSSSFTEALLSAMGVSFNEWELLSTDRFENVELSINGDDFAGRITTRVVINATVRLNGKVFYDHDEGSIRIRIDRARAGFLNVMGTLFDELNKIDSDSVTVNRPWVTINLAE